MKKLVFGLFGSFGVLALAACSGATATNDVGTQAQAQSTGADGGANGRSRHHHGPPPQAFEACQSKAAGDACSVTFGNESLAGKCVTPPADAPDTRIVCRPDKTPEGHGPDGRGPGGPGGRPHGPPPSEVFAACEGKAGGAACSVTLGDHTLDGTCKEPPPGVNETRLGCAPSHPPPPCEGQPAPQTR